jgi:hypothetical protein
MTDTSFSDLPSLALLGQKAIAQAALAIEEGDATTAERWLKVARSAGLDPASGRPEMKGETVLERRNSRDRLMAVLARRFERISLQMQEEADGVPRLPLATGPSEGET